MHIQMRRVIGIDIGDNRYHAGSTRQTFPLDADGGGFGHRVVPLATVLEREVGRSGRFGQVPDVDRILLCIHILVQVLRQDVGYRQLNTFLTDIGVFEVLVPQVGLQRRTTELAGSQ